MTAQELVVIERVKFDGSLLVRVGAKGCYVSEKLAKNILVERGT